MEVEDYRKVIDVDLVGPFIMAKHVVKYMIPGKEGKIINICSLMTELGRDEVGRSLCSSERRTENAYPKYDTE